MYKLFTHIPKRWSLLLSGLFFMAFFGFLWFGLSPAASVRGAGVSSCVMNPSPAKSGSGSYSFIDPDCPGKVVTPDLDIFPMNPPGSHFCITFTKNASERCILTSEAPKNVLYTYTIGVHCPAGKGISNIVISDPSLGITLRVVGDFTDTTITVPNPAHPEWTPGVSAISKSISADFINIATMTASYSGSTISLTSVATVSVADDCSNICSDTCPSATTYISKHKMHLCDSLKSCDPNCTCNVSGCGTCHIAADFAAPGNSPVFAVSCGVITKARWEAWGGDVRLQDDSGRVHQYLHLSSPATDGRMVGGSFVPWVTEGQRVNSGDIIGTIYPGSIASYSSGPHLHYAMSQGGVYLDPVTALPPQCIGTVREYCPVIPGSCFTCCP